MTLALHGQFFVDDCIDLSSLYFSFRLCFSKIFKQIIGLRYLNAFIGVYYK